MHMPKQLSNFACLFALIVPASTFHAQAPPISPATGLKNEVYEWRNQKIRYQVAGDPNSPHTAVLVHGLFVNSDHWRKTLSFLGENGYRAYAIDLLGCGYSSKPPRDSPDAKLVCGESRRFDAPSMDLISEDAFESFAVKDVKLGTANGGFRTNVDVELRHPLKSCYNFFTWADQIIDFTKDVVHCESSDSATGKSTTLVCNSIGTISSFQAALDDPDLFDGVFVVNPNFRELHVSEIPFPTISMPFVRAVQGLLRTKGYGLFEALAKPDTVKEILKEPYHVTDAVDETLVQVLLDPLLTEGAADVVFDTLSYSAGPLPEQQLQDEKFKKPVWVCYGENDPWTPPSRVERLVDFSDNVERVIALKNAGHCPHDEAPELVNPLLKDFLQRVKLGGSVFQGDSTSVKSSDQVDVM